MLDVSICAWRLRNPDKAEDERNRAARVLGAGARHHDRRQWQNAGAQDRQRPRGKGERQGDDEIHTAALSTFSTESFDVPQDMRATSFPPL